MAKAVETSIAALTKNIDQVIPAVQACRTRVRADTRFSRGSSATVVTETTSGTMRQIVQLTSADRRINSEARRTSEADAVS
jgi:hypothetical protein